MFTSEKFPVFRKRADAFEMICRISEATLALLSVKEAAYKGLVFPVLKYGNSVLDPALSQYISLRSKSAQLV